MLQVLAACRVQVAVVYRCVGIPTETEASTTCILLFMSVDVCGLYLVVIVVFGSS